MRKVILRARLTVAMSVALACGCGSSDSYVFPPKFLFGTAVAGFQVDMGCPTLPAQECEDANSDWYQYITSTVTQQAPNTHLSGDPPSAGPGHWELYASDFDLLRNELSANAFRFSLEWSRIFPTATDGIEGYDALKAAADPAALARYHAMLTALKARGVTPLVTLNHYTLPVWIHDAVGCNQDLDGCSPRGWVDRERTVREITKFAGFCAREFGGEVDLWVTLNEPFTAVLLAGYVLPTQERTNPPGVWMRVAAAREVFVALVEAHARMYDAVKAADLVDADGDGVTSSVGVVYPMTPVKPKDPANPLDVKAAQNLFYLFNDLYLNAVVKGDLDDDFDGIAQHRPDLAGRMDYLGINYYTRITVEGVQNPVLPDLSPLTTFNPLTLVPWEDYPRGIYEMSMWAKERGLPVIITENGIADPGEGDKGPSFLVRHLTWLWRAIREGVDVRGFFQWSLVDNYEWNHGMTMPFGLYRVDKDDPAKRRVARPAAAIFKTISERRQIPVDLRLRFPVDPAP